MKRFLCLLLLSIFDIQFRPGQTAAPKRAPMKGLEGIDLSEDGTLIVNIANGQIFRPGIEEPIATIDIPRPKRDRFPTSSSEANSFAHKSNNDKGQLAQFWEHDHVANNNHGCIVLYNTQKFCDVYNLPWAPNGSARVCKADIKEPPRMPSSYAVSRAGIFTLLGIISLTSKCISFAFVEIQIEFCFETTNVF